MTPASSSAPEYGISLWLPEGPTGPEREITSATLDAGERHDTITLFVRGELATRFTVRAGAGAAVLSECGLQRHP